MTESRGLESAGHCFGNQALVVAGWCWSSPVAAMTFHQYGRCHD